MEHQVAALTVQRQERVKRWRKGSKSPASPWSVRAERSAFQSVCAEQPDAKQIALAWMLGKGVL